MKKSNAIDGSIDFIESRLTEAIDVGELAQRSFFRKRITSGCFVPLLANL